MRTTLTMVVNPFQWHVRKDCYYPLWCPIHRDIERILECQRNAIEIRNNVEESFQSKRIYPSLIRNVRPSPSKQFECSHYEKREYPLIPRHRFGFYGKIVFRQVINNTYKRSVM